MSCEKSNAMDSQKRGDAKTAQKSNKNTHTFKNVTPFVSTQVSSTKRPLKKK